MKIHAKSYFPANQTAMRRLQAQSLNQGGRTQGTAHRGSDQVTLSPEAQQLTSTAGGNRLGRTGRNARAVHRRHGDQVRDLSNRGDVGRLISQTPQIDNDTHTQNDGVRCGGAALMNAMLLDGDHARNARAIRRIAEPVNPGRLDERAADGGQAFRMTRQQRQALDSMERGTLTGNQTSQLQEMLFQMADGAREGSAPNDPNNTGVTPDQMQRMVRRLGNQGAFPNTRELNLRMDRNGQGGYHWTTTSTNNSGTQHADSWPRQDGQGADGYARVEGVSAAQRGDYVYQSGSEVGTFGADVTLLRRPLGQPQVTGRAGSENLRTPESIVDFQAS